MPTFIKKTSFSNVIEQAVSLYKSYEETRYANIVRTTKLFLLQDLIPTLENLQQVLPEVVTVAQSEQQIVNDLTPIDPSLAALQPVLAETITSAQEAEQVDAIAIKDAKAIEADLLEQAPTQPDSAAASTSADEKTVSPATTSVAATEKTITPTPATTTSTLSYLSSLIFSATPTATPTPVVVEINKTTEPATTSEANEKTVVSETTKNTTEEPSKNPVVSTEQPKLVATASKTESEATSEATTHQVVLIPELTEKNVVATTSQKEAATPEVQAVATPEPITAEEAATNTVESTVNETDSTDNAPAAEAATETKPAEEIVEVEFDHVTVAKKVLQLKNHEQVKNGSYMKNIAEILAIAARNQLDAKDENYLSAQEALTNLEVYAEQHRNLYSSISKDDFLTCVRTHLIERLKQEYENTIAQQHEQFTNEIAQHTNQISDQTNQITTLNGQLNESELHVTQQDIQIDHLRTSNQMLSDEFSTTKIALAAAKQNLIAAKINLHVLETDKNSEINQLGHRLQLSNNTTVKQNEKISIEMARHRLLESNAKLAEEKHQKLLSAITARADNAETNLLSATNQVKKLSEQIKSLDAKILSDSNYSQQAMDIQKKFSNAVVLRAENAEANLVSTTNQIKKLNEQVKTLDEHILLNSTHSKQAMDAQQKVTNEMVSRADTAEQSLVNANTQIKELNMQLDKFKTRVADLNQMHSDLLNTSSGTTHQLSAVMTELKSVHTTNSNLTKKGSELEAKLIASEATVKALQKNINELKALEKSFPMLSVSSSKVSLSNNPNSFHNQAKSPKNQSQNDSTNTNTAAKSNRKK